MRTEVATNALEQALKEKGMNYKINPGDGAYGPKIDFHPGLAGQNLAVRHHSIDFQMPERFDLTYIGEDGERHAR